MSCELSSLTSVTPPPGRLTAVDLLFTAPELARLLRHALRDQDWLDAYLLAVGLTQMVEDGLQPDPMQLFRAAEHLRHTESPAIRAAGRVAHAAAAGMSAPVAAMRRQRVRRLRTHLATATLALAHTVVDHLHRPPSLPAELDRSLDEVVHLAPDVLRVPSCFRSFDQHPDDMVELARRFLERSDSSPRVCVVGVRTSGSYLAPLLAASLEQRGGPDVDVTSHRPGRPWERTEASTLRKAAAEGATILVVDDPPVTGGAISETVRAVLALGVPRHRVVVAAALAGAMPPPALASLPGVYLPWTRWSVHHRLTRRAVADALAEMLGPGHHVVASGPRRLPGDNRARVRARFSVTVSTESGTSRRELLVEGAGLGYFGRHAVAVATPLGSHVPRIYGVVDGLLYRDWAPGSEISGDALALAESVAGYVADRARALRVPHDRSAHLRGRGTSASAAALLLGSMFGRLAPLGRYVLLDRITRGLLRTESPSVPDGQTHTRYWRRSSPTGPAHKVHFHQQSFSNLEMTCYDSVFDLAGAALDCRDDEFERTLRRSYTARTGEVVDDERWLLYRLALLWRLGRTGEIAPSVTAVRSAAAVHSYLSAVVPAPRSAVRPAGPLCAVDLDGVLETSPLGYPCTTPLGAVCLRALTAHGYRPVPVTGRSLDDVIDLCRRFGLAGGVAEYGTVVYDATGDRWTDLRSAAAVAAVDRARAFLREFGGVEIDERYRFAVRARSAHGPLPADLTAGVTAATDGAVRAVRGQSQTDFVPREIGKASGLRRLTDSLETRVALAVGDSDEDLSMLALAEVRRAPRNASDSVRRSGVAISRYAYQAGLADACTDLLGHRPGACRVCAPARIPARTVVLCRVLGLRENGLRGLAPRTGRLALTLALRRWDSPGGGSTSSR